VRVLANRGEAEMLFAVIGFYKQGAESRLLEIHEEVNEYLGQPYRQPKVAGVLRDQSGRRVGNLLFFEANSFKEANVQLSYSPFHQHGLYERTSVVEYDVEVGQFITT
jgi:uncharacterized protein YciI